MTLRIALTSSDPVRAVEVIHNGRRIQQVACSQQVTQELSTTLTLDEPGWLLVRAIASVDSTFRFASTAPWYIQSAAGQRRISRTSAQFFLDWVDQRIERVRGNVTDTGRLRAVLEPHENARVFWQDRVRMANADLDTDARNSVEQTSQKISD